METQTEAFVRVWLRDNAALLEAIANDYLRRAKIRSGESRFVASLKRANGCDS
jgi:hypothetical protein